MSIAIKAENISKAYQLGEIGTGTISRDLERWISRIRGKEDPFLKIGETNDRTVKGESDVVWSLKDINFEIEQGSAVGIIGRNGAGKSTLLKILSRVTSPTNGRIKGNGRIASLLEVGTGFHPELTGKENIYLNGAILGMRKKEIARKFDDIVQFAGVERYINTPVKRYSSGMYVRLAFAVAAHLESEILIVDEVLAVGDAEFQKKCLEKMGDVNSSEGRTVLFVSHNMSSINKLCSKSILLQNGEISMIGNTNEVSKYYSLVYNKSNEQSGEVNLIDSKRNGGDGLVRFKKAFLLNSNNVKTSLLNINEPFSINIELESKIKNDFGEIGIAVRSEDYNVICSLSSNDSGQFIKVDKGELIVSFIIKNNMFKPGRYLIQFGTTFGQIRDLILEDGLNFEVTNDNSIEKNVLVNLPGYINYPFEFKRI